MKTAVFFVGQVVEVAVELKPLGGRNSRDDIIIKGFITGGWAIDLVFARRRKKPAQVLQMQIETTWSREYAAARMLEKWPVAQDVRYPVQLEGSWRPIFDWNEQGWETRKHQLYAAR